MHLYVLFLDSKLQISSYNLVYIKQSNEMYKGTYTYTYTHTYTYVIEKLEKFVNYGTSIQ